MYREAFINRLLYLLNLFATSVVFLFYCYDYFLILFSWECIGLFSFLLVNFYSTRIYTIKAALKTFVFSRISDMFMFLSFLMALNIFCSTDLSLIFMQVPFMSFHYLFFGHSAIHFLTLFSFCLVTSGGIKAAQFFSHVWLPDAMEAPTPASALIHSSTLVVAGIFLVIRFSILFEFTTFTNYYLALLGALTLSFGAITATFQNDIKKLVAYSTISQIGYLVCGCGFCCYEEVLIYLIVHALNKAFLFVLVGYIVHFFSGNTDMRQMGGAYIYSFDLCALLFGVCFNPLSVYVAQNDQGDDILYIYEVRNTFGDMHAYIGAPSGGHSVLEAQKIFHVSPFFPVAGTYRLHIRHDDSRISLAMRYLIGLKPALTATMRGSLLPLNSRSVIQGLWQAGQWPLRPLVSIHVEAVKLWMKKLQFYKRPAPPESAWSQARDSLHRF